MKFAASLVALTAAMSLGASIETEPCGEPDDILQISSLTFDPNPPVPGQNISATLTGISSADIVEGAYVIVVLKVGLIKLLSTTYDFCTDIAECPIAAGDVNITYTVALPKETPLAKYTLSVHAYSAEDDQLFCTQIVPDFTKSQTMINDNLDGDL